MDLNGLFFEYYKALSLEREDDFDDEFEDVTLSLEKTYKKWLMVYSDELLTTPAEYIAGIVRSNAVEEYAEECFLKGYRLDVTLYSALIKKASVEFASKWLRTENEYAAETAIKILFTKDVKTAETAFLDAIMDDKTHENVKLAAYDYLTDVGESVVDAILERINGASPEAQTLMVEIMAEYSENKAAYMWIVTLLYRGDEVALAANLLAKYGDPRAIEVLKSFALEYDMNYVEFMEVRNAVEALGGDFEYDKDFSDDPYFKLINQKDD